MLTPLATVLRSCERLRHLPEARWRQAPIPALGTRAPNHVPTRSGPSLEQRVEQCVRDLMHEDAMARGVPEFVPDVPVFAWPDVLAALAKSVAARDAASAALAAAAATSADW